MILTEKTSLVPIISQHILSLDINTVLIFLHGVLRRKLVCFIILNLSGPDHILSFSVLFPDSYFLNHSVLLKLLVFTSVLSLCPLHPHVFFGFLSRTEYLSKKVAGIFNLSLPFTFLVIFSLFQDSWNNFWCKCLLEVCWMEKTCFADLT